MPVVAVRSHDAARRSPWPPDPDRSGRGTKVGIDSVTTRRSTGIVDDISLDDLSAGDFARGIRSEPPTPSSTTLRRDSTGPGDDEYKCRAKTGETVVRQGFVTESRDFGVTTAPP